MKRIILTFICFLGLTLVVNAQTKDELVQKYRQALKRGIGVNTRIPAGVVTRGIGGVEAKEVVLNIEFNKNSFSIKPSAFLYLDALGEAIANDPTLSNKVFKVEGHTCDLGSDKYNYVLSKRRAQAIVKYLTAKYGLLPSQFIVVPYGESRPLVPNISEENRKKNRRVVVVNTGKEIKNTVLTDIYRKTKPIDVAIKVMKNGYITNMSADEELTVDDGYALEIIPKKTFMFISSKLLAIQ